MNLLVLNAGSSSLKYQLIEMPSERVKCMGIVERIGMKNALFSHEITTEVHKETLLIENHEQALNKIAETLMHPEIGVLQHVDEIEAVGHRVVHGGDKFKETVVVTEEVKDSIRELFALAPLHNPVNLKGIEIAETIFTRAKQVAIFDTAFHQTLPKEAYQYALPNEYLDVHKIRAYGFHGTSHKYVSEKAIAYLGKKSKRIISIHLGNGCSMSAIKEGKSIENSLGFGPMNGLVMGTRSGDLDPSVIFYLNKKLNKSTAEINELLQKESGLKGLTGYSDLRDIEKAANQGDENCLNALKIVSYRIKKFIGSYTAVLNGLDALIFTAGIGENSSLMRLLSCADLEYLGIELDPKKNEIRSKEIREMQQTDAPVKILVIPTNEELEIAKQSHALLKNTKKSLKG